MTSEEARSVVLGTVAAALRNTPRVPAPEPLTIFPSADVPDAYSRFRDELTALGGEVQFIASQDDLPAAIAAFVEERGIALAATQDSPLVARAVAGLPPQRVLPAKAATKEQIEAADCSGLEAGALIADTGSAVVKLRSYAERLLPYLPPTCLIVAGDAQLYAHMQDAKETLFDPARRAQGGEVVIVTGPSRTADIEKTVVLGAHGPRSLTVFIVGTAPITS